METRKIIERAVTVFPEQEKSGNPELVEALVSRGIVETIAWKIDLRLELGFENESHCANKWQPS